ncbi:cation efflux protein [Nadsonia fulvescens var. elongata DSM 6958]|uniref:Cation efflux protein n=1 Tax=Nadsonia fulvescens var. elongata DSM 6958 TaxID=857566 RepID=A0A1E3PQE1_9ASCO|nr:cation efflux protein [Nadsonia fulvescens var. elongata DSM 6958]
MEGKEFKIIFLLALDISFFLLEAIVGYTVHSLALVADSFHMLNDVFSLIIALWAVKVSKARGPDSKYTYGWQRAEILGALVNAVFLLALCFTIFLEAIQRFFEPQVINNPILVLGVGCAGLASNIVGLVLFHDHSHGGHSHGGHSHGGHSHGSHSHEGHAHDDHAHDHAHNNTHDHDHSHADLEAAIPTENTSLLTTAVSGSHHRSISDASITHVDHYHSKPKEVAKPTKSLNMEGVWIHVLGDALGNIGVIATALFIWKTDYTWRYLADPLVSLLITVIIFTSALGLFKRTSAILLQAVPQSVDAEEVKEDIASLAGIQEIHDLHIWILKEDLFIATLHVGVSVDPAEFMALAAKIRMCLNGHGISSVTIQPEFNVPPTSSAGSYHVSVGGLRSSLSNGCLVAKN